MCVCVCVWVRERERERERERDKYSDRWSEELQKEEWRKLYLDKNEWDLLKTLNVFVCLWQNITDK